MVRLSGLMACCLAATACGPGAPPQPTYERFTIELEGVAAEQDVQLRDQLHYAVTYKGPLARNFRVDALLTNVDTGESSEEIVGSSEPMDTTSVFERRYWEVRSNFLKQTGRIRIQLRATATATLKGSEPWFVESAPVFINVASRLDAIEVGPSGAPIPYGSPVTVTITGAELWDPVEVTVDKLDTGAPIIGLDLKVPFEPGQTSASRPWGIRDRSLESIGIQRLRLTARFGPLVVHSEPFELEVDHTLDAVKVFVRDINGNLTHASSSEVRLPDVQELVIHVFGTRLAGHPVQLDGSPPVVATSDLVEFRRTPTAADFPEGKGTRTYTFLAWSGMERSAEVTLRRWGFTRCEWALDSGQAAADNQFVPLGSKVHLRASGWGFPNTETFLLFKKHPAKFTLWEADGGQSNGPLPQPLVNNDDEVDTFDGDMISSQVDETWTTEFVEEVDFLHLAKAELYFEVRMEDEMCTSGRIVVPAP